MPTTPKASSLRASARRRAEFTRAFVGMQATLMQVPPTKRRSTIATRQPAFARSIASDLPALPPPTTSRSTSSIGFVDMLLLMLGKVSFFNARGPELFHQANTRRVVIVTATR